MLFNFDNMYYELWDVYHKGNLNEGHTGIFFTIFTIPLNIKLLQYIKLNKVKYKTIRIMIISVSDVSDV